TAFWQSSINLDVTFAENVIDPDNERATDPNALLTANYPKLATDALVTKLGVDPENRKLVREVGGLISNGVRTQLRDMVVADPSIIGTTRNVWVLASGDVDSAVKGQVNLDVDESRRKVSDQQLEWMRTMEADGVLEQRFNSGLFTRGASSRPETAGMGVAIVGSIYMMLIVLVLALPIGVAASIYLEEFAPQNKLTDLIEVNINNLAAVPSIVFGLLGLAVFINFMHLPRSASLVGGLVLTLMTLPTIIIATRAALRAVPPSIRAAALGLGASRTQTVFHHVLPLAAPGILTGTIIGLAQALGETAPLLLIGMVAFVADYPTTPLDPATALPVQIYMWANEAERAFVERTSGAIIVLLLFLAVMNITAIILRRRVERRW
ncbi:MAG: phosphate ABC transporter permease PstA, partial [Nitratireductor sp.]